MKKTMSGILALCAAIGWWGALYPEFTLVEGTYRIVCEDEVAKAEENMIESELDSSRLYWSILDADCSQIRLRSKLLTDWREFHESGNQ